MATRTRYAPDRGLTARMTATMFLLGLVFVGFVAALIGILEEATKQVGRADRLQNIAVVFGGGAAVISLFYSDKIALAAWLVYAQVVTPRSRCARAARHRGLLLCALADMDKLRVAIAVDPHAERVRDRPQQQELGALRHPGKCSRLGAEQGTWPRARWPGTSSATWRTRTSR